MFRMLSNSSTNKYVKYKFVKVDFFELMCRKTDNIETIIDGCMKQVH